MDMKKGIKGVSHVFWHLCRGYWRSEERWSARGLLLLLVFAAMGGVYASMNLTQWFNNFYDALQHYNRDPILMLMGVFAGWAFIYIFCYTYVVYLQQKLEIKWRRWMTASYLESWMRNQTYYRMQVFGEESDNPDQRISEDVRDFIRLTLQIGVGILQNLTTLLAFSFILWNLSGILDLTLGDTTFHIPGQFFWAVLLVAAVGTYMANRAGSRLIGLNFNQQRYEADFRFQMMRVRENSESVAFYAGESQEGKGFQERFVAVVRNFLQIARQTKILNFWVGTYGRISSAVPLLLAVPRCFAGLLTFGGFTQLLITYQQVETALSYFINVYPELAKLAAVMQRLGTFTEHMEKIDAIESGVLREQKSGPDLQLNALKVALPDGRVLLDDCSVELAEGSHILITGPSGCGKSTLLRTLAGIWPFGAGTLELPQKGRILFLPQRPYLPLGSLRQALYYPLSAGGSDQKLQDLLRLVGLEHLIGDLDKVDDWSRILSLGEQQRIAFARVLLVQPQWVFLDESTSALDEPREKSMYELIKKELPNCGIVSVGHRSTLFVQHETELHLAGDGTWKLRPIMAG